MKERGKDKPISEACSLFVLGSTSYYLSLDYSTTIVSGLVHALLLLSLNLVIMYDRKFPLLG